MRGKYPPTHITHKKQTFMKMTNLLILRISIVIEEFFWLVNVKSYKKKPWRTLLQHHDQKHTFKH